MMRKNPEGNSSTTTDESTMARKGPAIASIALIAALFFGGCSGCSDPCADVVCPDGLICVDGECVHPDPEERCTSDEDCADVQGRTRCDAVTGRCVECLVTSHCPNPERQICDTDENYCVPRPPCESHDDCADLPGAPYCNENSGDCVACLTDDHCLGRQQSCNPSSGTCHFQSCESDDDCAEYPESPHCNTGSGLCQECTHDDHCPEAAVCRNGACLPRGECESDDDCGVAMRCNTLSQLCVQCISSADCKLGGRCISSSCRASLNCETDSDCGSPLHCDADTGNCHTCTESWHCESGQQCISGHCMGTQTCGPGHFCGPGEECRDGSCRPFMCPPDNLDAGSNPYLAAPLEPGLTEGISLCPNTWHWFVFDAAMGDGFAVDFHYQAPEDHPDMLVWAGTGSGADTIGEPALTDYGQSVDVHLLTRPGPVYVGLRGVNEHLMASLDIDVVSGGLCDDDEYEPNHTPELAARLPDPVAGTTELEAIACFGNDDWFYLPVAEGKRVLASAETTDGSSNPLVLSLHERLADGTMRIMGGDGTSAAEAGPLDSPKDVYVRVTNGTRDGVPYRLDVTLRPPIPHNDDCFSPEPLLEGAPVSGTTAGASDTTESLCGGEGSPDVVYSITLVEPRTVRVVAEGALDTILSLRAQCDEPATELLCSDEPGDREEIEAVLPAGDWFVWVGNYEGREGAFEIELETSDPPPVPPHDVCDEAVELDAAAGGGIEEGDVALASSTVSPSCGGGGNDSFYLLKLDEPASLHAELEAPEGMSLSLRHGFCEGDETELVCEEVTSESAATVDLTYLEGGGYTLVVDGGGPAGGEYTLTWGLGTPLPPPENDTCDSPHHLDVSEGLAAVSGDTSGASGAHEATCALFGESGPDVVYSFELLDEAAIEAVLESEHDLVLELRGAACADQDAALSCSDASVVRIFEPLLPAGLYHLIVDGYSGDFGPFDLSVEVSDPPAVPSNDLCEDAAVLDTSGGEVALAAHTWLATNDLDPGTGCTGSPLSGPDVVYAVDLEAGDTMEATVVPEEGYDPAIYLLESCDAPACLTGADDYFVSEPETITFTATESGRYYLVVDAWRAGEAGHFDLLVDIE